MSDTINLSKGGNVNLAKEAAGQSRFVIGLGWNPDPSNPPDLDAAAFPCRVDANGAPVLISPAQESVVYFGNLNGPYSRSGAIVHGGDNLTGDGDGDDERIMIDTSKLDPAIAQIIVGIAIYQAAQRNQTFGLVRSAYVRIYDASVLEAAEGAAWNAPANERKALSDAELKALSIANYDLEEDAGQHTIFQFGSFYSKDPGDWRFKALGVGGSGDLNTFGTLLSGAPQPA